MRGIEGFRLYSAIVQRIGEFRSEGGGLTFQCHFGERHKNRDANWSARMWVGERGELVAKCLGCGAGWREYVSEIGLPVSAWFPEGASRVQGNQPQPNPVANYTYRRADGSVWGIKTRLEPGYHGSTKSFSWSRPVPAELRELCGIGPGEPAVIDGRRALEEGWFVPQKYTDGWHLRRADGPDTPRAVMVPDAGQAPLYRLPEVMAAALNEPVIFVEGERDSDLLVSLGFMATTTPNGASYWSYPEYGPPMKDRVIIAVADNDNVGIRLAADIVGCAILYGARQVRSVVPGQTTGYDVKPGGDIRDWLSATVPTGDKAKQREALLSLFRSLGKYDRVGESR